jgi:hypothetical protein
MISLLIFLEKPMHMTTACRRKVVRGTGINTIEKLSGKKLIFE